MEEQTVNQEKNFMKKANEFCKENQALIEVSCAVVGVVANVALGAVITKGCLGATNKIAHKTISALMTIGRG